MEKNMRWWGLKNVKMLNNLNNQITIRFHYKTAKKSIDFRRLASYLWCHLARYGFESLSNGMICDWCHRNKKLRYDLLLHIQFGVVNSDSNCYIFIDFALDVSRSFCIATHETKRFDSHFVCPWRRREKKIITKWIYANARSRKANSKRKQKKWKLMMKRMNECPLIRFFFCSSAVTCVWNVKFWDVFRKRIFTHLKAWDG